MRFKDLFTTPGNAQSFRDRAVERAAALETAELAAKLSNKEIIESGAFDVSLSQTQMDVLSSDIQSEDIFGMNSTMFI